MANSLHDPRYAKLIDRLVAAREAEGLTQRDLAARLKRPQSYVSKVETMQRRIDLLELIDLLTVLQIDPSSFVADFASELRRRR